MNEDILALFIPIISTIGLFSFLTVASWMKTRRKEREAYYKNETLKKLAEMQGNTSGSVLDFLREEEQITSRRRKEGQKLAGLINIALGIGVTIFLWRLIPNKAICLAGLIPLLMGIALLIYVYVLVPPSEKTPG